MDQDDTPPTSVSAIDQRCSLDFEDSQLGLVSPGDLPHITDAERLKLGNDICRLAADRFVCGGAKEAEGGWVDVDNAVVLVRHQHPVGHFIHDCAPSEGHDVQEPVPKQPPGSDDAHRDEREGRQIEIWIRREAAQVEQIGSHRDEDSRQDRVGLPTVDL